MSPPLLLSLRRYCHAAADRRRPLARCPLLAAFGVPPSARRPRLRPKPRCAQDPKGGRDWGERRGSEGAHQERAPLLLRVLSVVAAASVRVVVVTATAPASIHHNAGGAHTLRACRGGQRP